MPHMALSSTAESLVSLPTDPASVLPPVDPLLPSTAPSAWGAGEAPAGNTDGADANTASGTASAPSEGGAATPAAPAAAKQRSPAAEAHAAILEGRIAMVRGELDLAEVALKRALVYAKQAEGPAQIAAAYRQMAELASLRGDPMGATNSLQRALFAVERAGDRGAQAEVMVELGRLIEQGGKADRARQIFLDALNLATAANAQDAVAGAAGELGRLLGQQGDIDAALRHYLSAAKAYCGLPDGPDQEAAAQVYAAMADLEEVRRDIRAATAWREEAWALPEATPDTRRGLGGKLGWGLLLARRRADGLEVLEEVHRMLLDEDEVEGAAALRAQIEELRGWPQEGAGFAFALVRHGERRAAEGALALDAEDQLKRGDLKGALCSLGALYWLLHDRGDQGGASRAFKRAMSLAAAAPDEQRLLRKLRKNLETAGQA